MYSIVYLHIRLPWAPALFPHFHRLSTLVSTIYLYNGDYSTTESARYSPCLSHITPPINLDMFLSTAMKRRGHPGRPESCLSTETERNERLRVPNGQRTESMLQRVQEMNMYLHEIMATFCYVKEVLADTGISDRRFEL